MLPPSFLTPTPPTATYPLSLHDALPISISITRGVTAAEFSSALRALSADVDRDGPLGLAPANPMLDWPHVRLHPLTFDRDRKSTRLNSSHSQISYAVFCLKKKTLHVARS